MRNDDKIATVAISILANIGIFGACFPLLFLVSWWFILIIAPVCLMTNFTLACMTIRDNKKSSREEGVKLILACIFWPFLIFYFISCAVNWFRKLYSDTFNWFGGKDV